MKKYISMALAVVISAGMLAGCGGGGASQAPAGGGSTGGGESAPAESAGTDSTSSGDGSKIVFALDQEVEEFDPTLNTYSVSSTVLQNLYRGLYKLDSSNTPVPAYAEGYQVDETGTKYTFTLKDGAKWSDGSPLTAHDFEYSWKRVVNPEIASKTASSLFMIKNAQAFFEGNATIDDVAVKAVDDKTLEVELEGPVTYFISLLCTTAFYPVKAELVEAGTEWKKNAETYICTGPFMMKEMRPGEKYILEKNPNYIDADQVKLDTLEMVIIENQEAELAAYMNDEIDVSNNPSSESFSRYNGTDEMQVVDRIGMVYYDINATHEPFNDPRVRKALAMAIDRKVLVENIVQIPHRPAYGVIPYIIPDLNEPTKEYRETIGDLFTEDVEEAKRLLAEAGFPNGEGFPTIQFLSTTSQTYKDLAQAMQSMWKDNLGINSDIITYESQVYWSEQELGNFDIMYDGWTGDYLDPMTMLLIFDKEKQSYQTRWENEEFSRLLAETVTTNDQAKRMESFVAAEKLLMDEMPIIPAYFRVAPFICKPNIEGVFKNYIGHVYFEYASVK